MHSSRLLEVLNAEKPNLVPFPDMVVPKEIDNFDDFEDLVNFGKKPSDSKIPDASGAYKVVKFARGNEIDMAEAIAQDEKSEKQTKIAPLQLAFILPIDDVFHRGHSTFNTRLLINAYQLLHRKNVPDDFNLLPLHYDSHGRMVFLKGESELFRYLKHKGHQLTFEDIRHFAADAILAVYDLHSRQIVHRDIKSENFLIFEINGVRHIKQNDHDSAVEVTDENRLIGRDFKAGSPATSPPELTQNNNYGKDLDLKAVDLHQLGILLVNELFYYIRPAKLREDTCQLFRYLRSRAPENRGTIEKLLENPLFGDTPDERKDFFAERRKKIQRKLIFNGVPVYPSPDINDPTLLLDKTIKPIFCAATQLAEDIAETVSRPDFRTMDQLPVSLLQKELTLEKACAEKLNPQFKQFASSVLFSARRDLTEIAKPELALASAILHDAITKAFYVYQTITPATVIKNNYLLFYSKIKNPDLVAASKLLSSVTTAVMQKENPWPLVSAFLANEVKDSTNQSFQRILQNYLQALPVTVRDYFQGSSSRKLEI